MDVVVKAFRQFGTTKNYKKNEFIFQENDRTDATYFVESGLVKISQFSQEGQGITLFLRGEGEIFGNAEVLAGLIRQRYARCLSASELISIDARKVVELAKGDAEFAYSLAVIGARRLLDTQKIVETLISRPVSWRLAWLLVQMGKPFEDRLEVQLPLSHEEISYVIGCSRQTVTETLNKWSESKLIDYTKKKVTIFNANSFLADI
jgi:CRP-like cAMP-binding protein